MFEHYKTCVRDNTVSILEAFSLQPVTVKLFVIDKFMDC